ncbi:MAG: hypothetical protein PUE63_07745 [Lachnospiraceae bacterium]|nr:hypothetical protein [Lachnospiraceae bacterium]
MDELNFSEIEKKCELFMKFTPSPKLHISNLKKPGNILDPPSGQGRRASFLPFPDMLK